MSEKSVIRVQIYPHKITPILLISDNNIVYTRIFFFFGLVSCIIKIFSGLEFLIINRFVLLSCYIYIFISFLYVISLRQSLLDVDKNQDLQYSKVKYFLDITVFYVFLYITVFFIPILTYITREL